jgi:hypothetical protein
VSRGMKSCVFASAAVLLLETLAFAASVAIPTPGCDRSTPQQCVALALEAMGGRERLAQVTSVHLQTVGHTLLMEQSYRQAPFITSYERDEVTLDLAKQRVLVAAKVTWPESDPNQAEAESTLVAGPDGGVNRAKSGDTPCSLSDLQAARQMLALGPARVLLTAAGASDLHYEAAQVLRETAHTIVAFRWGRVPVRVFINSFNHLPDAIETTQTFNDFWFFWGDVRQRIYFDNWKLVQGVTFPSNLVEERNGAVWSSMQALTLEFNVPIDDKNFVMAEAAAKQSAASAGWNQPFSAKQASALAPGIDFFAGSWNTTVVKQDDGIVILETPISSVYTHGLIGEARRRYPGVQVKAILSTSDSWPHTGGVREALSNRLPVYILDLNQPLLDRLKSAPHTLLPDALQESPGTALPWRIVSKKEVIGSGANEMQLYPLRGASTERQYMVYFPRQRLLYASDTLSINDDGSLYDPELMYEVSQAVRREGLAVDTVFAMHQSPMAWDKVMALLEKSRRS